MLEGYQQGVFKAVSKDTAFHRKSVSKIWKGGG